MASSEKLRVVVLGLFIIALIAFAALYRPTHALSRPAKLDKEIHPLDFLSFDERDDLLAFMESLTASMPENLGPPPDLAKNLSKKIAKSYYRNRT